MEEQLQIVDVIKKLQTTLIKLESDYKFKFNDLELRGIRNESIDLKLIELEEIQKQVLTFNIGGKLFSTSKKLITSCIYDNIFKDLLQKAEEKQMSSCDLQNIFIDRNPDHFPLILDIVRRSYDEILKADVHSPQQIIKIALPQNIIMDSFKDDIFYYFKTNAVDILEDFSFKYYDLRDKVWKSFGAKQSSLFAGFEIRRHVDFEEIKEFRAAKIDEINYKKGNAFFVGEEGDIIITLREAKKVSVLMMKPFEGALDVWNPTKGAGAFIYGSVDKVNWEKIGVIPGTYGEQLNKTYEVDLFKESSPKYLKFETQNFQLSISYLKLRI